MLRKRREDRATLVGRLYDAHGGSLYRYALMLLADHAAAEDAVHQVFATLLRSAGAIENEIHYQRRSVRNECYTALRKQRARSSDDRPLFEPVTLDVVASEDRLALERALATLPAEQREVVHLHVFEGMTFQEVAGATGESINTAASRYRYALGKLREVLKPL